MVKVHATVLGGLPVVADVWYSGPDYDGEYDTGVNTLYWRKRNGSCGKELSPALLDRIEQQDNYWQASVTEQANDWLGEHAPTRRRSSDVLSGWETTGSCSEEYQLLNGKKG